MSHADVTLRRMSVPCSNGLSAVHVGVRSMPDWKRLTDLVGAGVGLVVCSPIMLLAAIAVKLSSPGPVIFRQRRAGLGGRPFTVYKFRSMFLGAEAQKHLLMPFNEQTGPVFKMKRDPRVTPVGRLIRKLSIDELPQLWNVMKGQMSLVGPRPLPCDEIPCYENGCCSDGRKFCRLSVKPGLTCYWQVAGRSEIGFEEWIRLDLKYAREMSFLTDLKILLLTIPAVLSLRGAG